MSPTSDVATESAASGLDDQSLPGWIYHDAEFFEAEKEAVFRTAWQLVCHVNDVPNSGDFHTLDFLGEAIVAAAAPGELEERRR